MAELAPASPSLGRVAIVHDYLNQRGGAERVVLEMSDMWPQAPIYTSLYRPDSTFEEFRGRDIRTSFIDRIPVDRSFRNLFPLYPAAFWSFGEIDADIVIASSSGWAHMARAVQSAVHVVYCHTPARWLYRDDYMRADGRPAPKQALLAPFGRALRSLDARAARRADAYVVNSVAISRRVQAIYGFDAPVVYPPVHTERLQPTRAGSGCWSSPVCCRTSAWISSLPRHAPWGSDWTLSATGRCSTTCGALQAPTRPSTAPRRRTP